MIFSLFFHNPVNNFQQLGCCSNNCFRITLPSFLLKREPGVRIRKPVGNILQMSLEGYKEFGGIPNDLETPGPQYIYALVRDAYNQNLHGNLPSLPWLYVNLPSLSDA